ncbi:MAG: DUF4432 domain-containing protein [Marinomonas sp.]|nr:MAG: DUF4432 domain-containing protein [Marinomonas sp.]
MANNTTATLTILSQREGIDLGDFQRDAKDFGLPENVTLRIEQVTLFGGKQHGSRLILLTVGATTLRVIPTRGMGILDAIRGGVRFGWDSPVKEVVHPSFINQEASGGCGWLDGFNEMMVRCGYQWSGHPGEDRGEFLTLHGRIQNTPADEIVLEVDQQPPYAVRLRGRVDEKRFKFTNFELQTTLTLTPSSPYIEVRDTLTNLSSYDNTCQAIYHNNFGEPILGQGARLHVTGKKVAPFNDYAATGLDSWAQIPAPTPHFDEMVFNIESLADEQGMAYALLESPSQAEGIEVAYQVASLPVLTIWKNVDTEEQGYVVGIEPGTSYAYNRRHQWDLGLVPTIKAKESKQFYVRFGLFTTEEEVQASKQHIANVQDGTPLIVESAPTVRINEQ